MISVPPRALNATPAINPSVDCWLPGPVDGGVIASRRAKRRRRRPLRSMQNPSRTHGQVTMALVHKFGTRYTLQSAGVDSALSASLSSADQFKIFSVYVIDCNLTRCLERRSISCTLTSYSTGPASSAHVSCRILSTIPAELSLWVWHSVLPRQDTPDIWQSRAVPPCALLGSGRWSYADTHLGIDLLLNIRTMHSVF